MRNSILFICGLILCLAGCQADNQQVSDALKIYGPKEPIEKVVNGEQVIDTVYHTIEPFQFVDQEGQDLSNSNLEGKIYVADFFFTTCPSICPIMSSNMLNVYEKFGERKDFKIVSHSLDPEYDSVSVLKDYADRIGVPDNNTWHFITGEKADIYQIGQSSYMVTAAEDEDAPGGVLHSGAFLLIDRKGRIRGVYDGTEANEVEVLMNDIEKLYEEAA